MPDKEIMAQIRAREDARPWVALDMLVQHNVDSGEHSDKVALADALGVLVDDWRATADLYNAAKLKGAMSTYITPLRHAAAELDKVIKGLERPRPSSPGAAPALTGYPIEWCGSNDDHDQHQWTAHEGTVGQVRRICDGPRPPRDLSGLDALIADASAPRQQPCPAADLGHEHPGPHTWICGPGRTEATCTGHPALRESECCENMLEPGEDPAPWCDGRKGVDHGEHGGSCKYKAHLRKDHPMPEVVKPHAFEVGPGATGAACTAMVVYDGAGDACGLPPTHPVHMTLDPAVGPDYTGGAFTDTIKADADATLAYPRGETNDLPADPGAPPHGSTDGLFPGALTADELAMLPGAVAYDPTPAAVVMAAREIGATMPEAQLPASALPVPVLGQAGINAGAYDHTYTPPGGRAVSFTELLAPVPAAALPAHLSHSHLNDAGDCAAKYRMQRVESLPQVPQWANIGGTALHAAIEAFERKVLAGEGDIVVVVDNAPGAWHRSWDIDIEATWQQHFEQTIAVVALTSGIPESRWRSSRKGAEGRTFWEVQGPLMLARYLAARPAGPTAMLPDGAPFGPVAAAVPAIEYAITVQVPTAYGPVPFKAEIDRITLQPDGSLEIKDYKSSYERPTDPTQLGRYAWVLRLAGVVPEHIKITGTYFDARRGTWTEPVDLAEAYPWEAFLYDVTTGHANKLRLTTGPTPAHRSNYCGGCSVRYACPIMALGVK